MDDVTHGGIIGDMIINTLVIVKEDTLEDIVKHNFHHGHAILIHAKMMDIAMNGRITTVETGHTCATAIETSQDKIVKQE